MTGVVVSRLFGSAAAVFGASVVSFLFLRVLPGDPARLILGPFASKKQIADLTHELGLDDPMPVQYAQYISDFFRGDWGHSFGTGASVTTLMKQTLPASIELGLYAFAIAFIGAVVLALVATYRRRPWVDRAVRALSFLGLGMAPFWLGLLLLLLFFEALDVLPGPDGRLGFDMAPPPAKSSLYTIDALLAGQWGVFWDAFKHLILPAFTLAFLPFAYLVRLLRANLLEVSREPFLVVVRSKGLSRWTTFARHALPNAFLPTLTAAGLIFAQLITNAVLVEKVFNWPGVGALVVDSILRQDFAVVQAFILLAAFMYVVVNLLVDVLYGVIDPRVRARTGLS